MTRYYKTQVVRCMRGMEKKTHGCGYINETVGKSY